MATHSWRRKWQPTPVFFPGKFHGWRSLVGYSPWGRKESDTTERLQKMSPINTLTLRNSENEEQTDNVNLCKNLKKQEMLLLVALVIDPDGSKIICVTYIISKTKMK